MYHYIRLNRRDQKKITLAGWYFYIVLGLVYYHCYKNNEISEEVA